MKRNPSTSRIPRTIEDSWYKALRQTCQGEATLLITTKGTAKRIEDVALGSISDLPIEYMCDNVESHPELQHIEELLLEIPQRNYSQIVAIGGGSVIDTAKVVSLYLNSSHSCTLSGYLRGEQSLPCQESAIPIIAIPTTCGTGSEVTPFATIWDKEKKSKFSISSERLIPSEVILDHSLLKTLPKNILISSGLDTLSHALESVWNKNMTLITNSVAKESIRLSLKWLSVAADTNASCEALKNLRALPFRCGNLNYKNCSSSFNLLSFDIKIWNKPRHCMQFHTPDYINI